ncbi:MAG: prolipoprotein diacylglyceryl transferase [Clostridiales bacterium]|nr:prolipoprotein diacylglyceryl transferase [Clostridiales bacterium]
MMESPGRIAFSIGGFDVMWYGVMLAIGILCAFIVIYYRAPKYHGISADRTFMLEVIILIAGIVGTRVYYVIFEWEYYSANPGEILNFRAGGLAIHGGLILGCLVAALLARIYKEKFFNIVDVFFVGIPLGQAIGRWGNFFNSEAHGTPTDLPWAVIVDGVPVHPTFLYESIWCFILVIILWQVDNRRKFVGQTFLLYCILYSAARFFIEGLRTDSLIVYIGSADYKQAQVLSIIVIICAGVLYALFYKRARHLPPGAVNTSFEEDKAVEEPERRGDSSPPADEKPAEEPKETPVENEGEPPAPEEEPKETPVNNEEETTE